MRRIWRAAAVVALPAFVCAALAPPRDARADAAPARQRRTVQVTVVGAADEAGPLVDAIRELLARLQLTTADASDAVPQDAVLARVRIDLTRAGEASLLVSDGQSGEVVEQRSVPRDASAAIVREELAHAAQSAVESEILGEQDRARRAPPPPPPPPPPPAASAPAPTPAPVVAKEQPVPPPPSSSFALDLATLAGGGPFGSGSGAVVRVGGAITAASRRGLRPAITGAFTYALPFDAHSSWVDSHAKLASVRGLASIEIARTSWLAFGAGVGGGLDVLSIEPRSALLPPSSLGDATTRTDPVLTGAVTLHVAMAPGVVLSVDALVDGDLASRRYVLRQGDGDESVFAPWRVRPTILAGFAFTALGESLFAARAPAPAPTEGAR